jgi:DNA-binding MarR family transcriptional regulator
MEILRGGRISGDERSVTDEQISFAVRGFVQVWTRFEDALAKELAAQNGSKKAGERDSRLTTTHAMLFRVGSSIINQGGVTMGELSAALSVPLSTATRIVDSLVAEGYVQRLHDTDDRRIVRVSFTDHGRQFYDIMNANITERIRQIGVYLKEDELKTLLFLLNKVSAAVRGFSS